MEDLTLYANSQSQSLINTVPIYCNDIAMKFGLYKCDALTMDYKIHYIRQIKNEGIELPKGNNIKNLDEKKKLYVPDCTLGILVIL